MIIILNAHAGRGYRRGRANLPRHIGQLFADAGLNPEIIVVAGKDLTCNCETRRGRCGSKNNRCRGGDGTVSTVAAKVAGSDSVLGVLPVGTLNHFARDLHLPLRLGEAVRTVVNHHVAKVDIGEVNGRVFINNSIPESLSSISFIRLDVRATLKHTGSELLGVRQFRRAQTPAIR